MCMKCSFDIGSGHVNNCWCACNDITFVDSLDEGDVYGCQACSHLINGFQEHDEEGF